MKLKCIACEALARIVYWNAANSEHVVDVQLMRLGWHKDPDDLRARLQAEVDAAQAGSYDAIVLAYGLCGRSTQNLRAQSVPVVLPRAHDCITVFLGSRSRYMQQFDANPGTYWYVRDYVERAESGASLSLGAETSESLDKQYDEFVRKYGKDNADYLMEVMGAWQAHYNRAAYIQMGVTDNPEIESRTRDQAQQRGWNFERLAGDMILVRKLLSGDWDDDFLIVQPGQQIAMTYDERVIRCVPAEAEFTDSL